MGSMQSNEPNILFIDGPLDGEIRSIEPDVTKLNLGGELSYHKRIVAIGPFDIAIFAWQYRHLVHSELVYAILHHLTRLNDLSGSVIVISNVESYNYAPRNRQ